MPSGDNRYIGIPPDHVIHEDQVYAADTVPELWHLPESIFEPIWEDGITGEGVLVSINDTGVATHHHLPRPVAARNFTGGGNGVNDRNGHGSHCAGISLGRGGLGVAPDAGLLVAKVLSDNGSGSTTGINAGRVWAAQNGADVVSESLGGPQGDRRDIQSILQAYDEGCQLVVAAAGNSGYRGGNTIGYPGKYLETWCIGSYRRDGQISTFSSGGREIDCATPGEQIISASHRGGFIAMSGTSMATPFFAGLMALIVHKRRIVGLPDIHGSDAWRDWFNREGFFEDAGQPGTDVRFGLGKPLITNILEWLKEPAWI